MPKSQETLNLNPLILIEKILNIEGRVCELKTVVIIASFTKSEFRQEERILSLSQIGL